ncbi:arginine decarboxylase [Thermotomaculum hydrothermale]|uniref:Arginine decarboxylase n=1 Tax=Thermotomaculum hydrothermale TaxID=981385 RepID=A0A7R6PG40_9BACT|nr:biosynthetic arginine decarboxylase [Thermotomaculum hydrothermale]BBB33108.1 arginine decarboxylase [Thermotomaculum hydrothermale]
MYYLETPEDYYRIKDWGVRYFSVNEKGNLCVNPTKKQDVYVEIPLLVKKARKEYGLNLPITFNFGQIIDYSISKIVHSFEKAIKEFGGAKGYKPVYPIKVNQDALVVEQVLKGGKGFSIGIEAGSKAELCAIIEKADKNTTVICNGFKDIEYIKLIKEAANFFDEIFVVIDKFSELFLIEQVFREAERLPFIGIRCRLHTRGTGKWEMSGGDYAKFGLTAMEILKAIDFLKNKNLLDRVKLLHAHIGSQITHTVKIKEMVYEAGVLYCELKKLGVDIKYIDFGGGLAVDYDGSKSATPSSANYTITEYANNIIFHLKEVCDAKNVEVPFVLTESGRAMVAYHSFTVFNVFEYTSLFKQRDLPERYDYSKNEILLNLKETFDVINSQNLREYFHDAVHFKNRLHTLFNEGLLTLEEKAVGEVLFWNIVKKASIISRKMQDLPEELENLDSLLAVKYVSNFSIFNSIPDFWAIKQLFPVCPIERLNEIPVVNATLVDITCDSDGKIDRFVDFAKYSDTIKLHKLNDGEYLLGVFLTGAYQKTLGNIHNLFGETGEVWVSVNGENQFEFDSVSQGKSVEELLKLKGYNVDTVKERIKDRDFISSIIGKTSYLKTTGKVFAVEKQKSITLAYNVENLSCPRCRGELISLVSDASIVSSFRVDKDKEIVEITLESQEAKPVFEELLVKNGFSFKEI